MTAGLNDGKSKRRGVALGALAALPLVVVLALFLGYSGARESERATFERAKAEGYAEGAREGNRRGRAKGRRDGEQSGRAASAATGTAPSASGQGTEGDGCPPGEYNYQGNGCVPNDCPGAGCAHPPTGGPARPEDCPPGAVPVGETGACAPADGGSSVSDEDYEYEKDVYEREGCSAATPERCRG